MTEKNCKHKWHFMEKEYLGGEYIWKYRYLFGWMLEKVKPITNINAVFVCEDCGEIKRTKIKLKNKKMKGGNEQ